jgi:hypothetical protein
MTENDSVQHRNAALSFEFQRYVMAHPEFEGLVPDGATVVLLPEFDLELAEYNKELGRQAKLRGEQVVSFRFQHNLQRTSSHLKGLVVAETEPPYGQV